MNAHDAIVDAVLAALRSPTSVSSGLIDEDIDATTIPEAAAEVISVSVDSSVPNRNALRGMPVQWNTDIVVECYARADGRTSTGRASRALHQRAYARLMADPALGGKVLDMLEPILRTDRDQQDTRLGCCIATYTVVHRTAAGSLEQPA